MMAHLNGIRCEIWLILRDYRSLKTTFREEQINNRDIIYFYIIYLTIWRLSKISNHQLYKIIEPDLDEVSTS